MVSTSRSSQATASIKHDRAGSPSIKTVQAPQTPCSQPRWVPVRFRRSRKKSANDERGGTSSATAAPLMRKRIAVTAAPAELHASRRPCEERAGTRQNTGPPHDRRRRRRHRVTHRDLPLIRGEKYHQT